MTFAKLTLSEIEQCLHGECEFALYEEEGIIFLCWRIGWMAGDSPYYWPIQPERYTPDPAAHPLGCQCHGLLSITFVDSKTRLIVALRALTWSPEFTAAMEDAIRRQVERRWIDAEAYAVRVRAVYERISSIEMFDKATVRCKGGE